MRFFNIDLHISVIADMKKIFEDLGHQVDDVSLSDHTWVFDRQKDSIPMLDNSLWMQLTCDQMSDMFYDQYKSTLKDYDAFIVTYPPPFSLLYKKFDKPIIINIPIRYEWPFSFRPIEWEKFNQYLKQGVSSGKIILVANNLTDKEYAEAYLGVEVKHIPSLCEYFPEKYTGTKDEFICSTKSIIPELENSIIKSKAQVLPDRYTYKELLAHKGTVHLPYACSYMSIFEEYTANMPLFVPDIDFLMKLYSEGRTFQQILFSKIYGDSPTTQVPTTSTYNPNNYEDLSVIRKLAEGSDFYDVEWMPHVQQFTSFDHLIELVSTVDTQDISKKMMEYNKDRKKKIYGMWKSLLKEVV
jgi:hypothetical protein